MASRDVRFVETQRLPPWIWVVAGCAMIATTTALVAVDEIGPVQVAGMVLLPLIVAGLARMTTRVTSEELRVVFPLLPGKRVPAGDIAACEAVEYRPLLHYGGWGWRWSPTRGWAYTMRGTRGVVVHPRDGKSFLVGSQRPDELAAAIRSIAANRLDPSAASPPDPRPA